MVIDPEFDICVLAVTPTPATGKVGDTITLAGGPFSIDYDTNVRINGVEATIVELTREDCGACDTCRSAASCDGCEYCEDCTSICEPCTESVVVTVPQLDPGTAQLVVVNRYGSSAGTPFTVETP